jgi:A-macroglobulin complement component/alpha-2-macroglobulin family protein/MG2 domain-containing protein/A-macroglobulin receptor
MYTAAHRSRRTFQIRSAAFGRAYTALACIATLSLGVGLGCSGDKDRTELASPELDHNGSVRVDADAIRGTLDGDRVHAEISVEGLASGDGAVYVSLRSVDDSELYSDTRLEYSVQKGETLKLETALGLPEAVSAQAGLVTLNLVVRAEGNLRVTRSLLHVIPPYEVRVEGPGRISAGKTVSYRVAARDPLTLAPLPNQSIDLTLSRDGAEPERHTVSTDADGTATLELAPAVAGAYSIQASSALFGVPANVTEDVQVSDASQRLLLTTDKPIYKPGQTVHLRALSLAATDRHPNGDADVTFEIEDGKGNKIFKKTIKSDAYGIASSDFALGQVLNQGTFEVRASSGSTTTKKTVDVFEYALPKYKLAIETDKTWYLPGENVAFGIDARYFFGKAVANATVSAELVAIVTGETLIGRVQSRTNAEGHLEGTLTLPTVLPRLDINAGNALAFLRITATDAAGQVVTQDQPITVAADPVRVVLVPESGQLIAGVENQLDLFVSDPVGAPLVGVTARAQLGGSPQSITTDAFGQARFVWQPGAVDAQVDVDVDVGGRTLTRNFSFSTQEGAQHLLVRTDRAVYDVGDDVTVEVLTTGSGPVYVDWLNDGQAVDMRTLTAQNGVARFTVPLDTNLLGENRIQAYVVDADGNIVRSGRTLFGRGGGHLSIAMTSDRAQYAPGEPAQLTFAVTDETGAPAVAALGVQIVDEAVFGVIDARPGLLETYFELQDDFAQPSYEIQAPGGDLGSLILQQTASSDAPTRAAAQVRAAANLAALGSAKLTGVSAASWAATVTASQGLLAPFVEKRKPALVAELRRTAKASIESLRAEGCRAEDYYCAGLSMGYLEALSQGIAQAFVGYDFWGNAYTDAATSGVAAQLVSAGPDERPGTSDDLNIAITFQELDLGSALPQVNFDANGVAGQVANNAPGFDAPPEAAGIPDVDNAAAGGAGGTGSGAPPSKEASSPRVRQDFPETLYVNPAIITDASGHATIGVDMADSITEWRVSTLGHTLSGQLGGATSGVTVFQDFFVDVSFPATFTRGDEATVPVAVYNYLDTPQTVQLELAAADWYTPLGNTTLSVDLAPGEVRGVSVPLRIEQVGLQTLTVEARGASRADAVARRVRVIPDGKAFPVALSGSLPPGSISQSLDFPAGAVPGSEQMYLNVYPAFFAQAVSGMDSVLQVPSGCFEQTTSTTWPNVLVTQYMQATHQITPEIQLRAESLISAGYQRLLTFEHPGGGFSWFGTQDGAAFLSVTAFGLMEFADMKVVSEVDERMIARTQTWLASQQESDGSWKGDQSEFFTFQTSTVRNTAFVLWALAESGYQGPAIQSGLAFINANMNAGPDSDDPYTLALIANAMVYLAAPGANDVLARLDAAKKAEGDEYSWTTPLQTNFYGGGKDADVAATALVTHAMLRANAYPGTVKGALAFITGAKDPSGNFGSTQATTWSLKALVLAATHGTEGAVGTLDVSVDGDDFAQVELRADAADVMTTVDMSGLANTGSHQVDLTFVGTGQVSYNLVGSHNLPWAALPPEPAGPLSIAVSYDETSLAVDESVHASARIENLTSQTANMILVTLGVPPGFEVQTGDFQRYLDAGVLSRVEQTGKQLILYVSELGAGQVQAFEYSLLATLPVSASDGGAEVSLYYEPDQKSQAPATTLIATAQ